MIFAKLRSYAIWAVLASVDQPFHLFIYVQLGRLCGSRPPLITSGGGVTALQPP